MNQEKNIYYQNSTVTRSERGQLTGQLTGQVSVKKFQGCTLWFTGLSGSGKSTIAFGVEQYLVKRGISAYTLDGDNVRHGLNSDLGFSAKDREENIRRVAEVSKLFADSGIICLSSFISPFKNDRLNAKNIHLKDKLRFFECYLDTPLNVCESRDVKGLYKKARKGLIKGFTGIDQPYEVPDHPDLILETAKLEIEQCIQAVITFLIENDIIEPETIEPIELFIPDDKKEFLIQEAEGFESLEIDRTSLQWLQVLSEGWATPLRGFMREKEYLSCLHFSSIFENGRLHSQSIPIVLAINDLEKSRLENKNTISLKYENELVAVLRDIEIYPHRKVERCTRVFGCLINEHPSIKLIMDSGDWLVGGELEMLKRVKWNDGLDEFRLTPKEIKTKLKEMGADISFVFQLRNPIHNGHAFLMNDTKRMLKEKGYKNPVLLLHPLGGWTKDDDVPLNVRIDQHKAVLAEGILDEESTLVAIFPSPMSYAGPREVQWHAKSRIHTGSNCYIVGRDPAGITNPNDGESIYNPEDGAKVLAMTPGLSNLQIIPFKVAAYNKKLKKMTFFDESDSNNFEFISGTKMRKLARSGELPPEGFMGIQAWSILAEYYKNLEN